MNLIHLFLFLILSISPAFSTPPYDYEKAWREVDRFLSENLPKSAAEKVEEIRVNSIREKNDPQWFKAAVYTCRITVNHEESGLEKAILYVREERNNTKGSAHAVITALLSSLYSQYVDNNRYLIGQRTPIRNNTSMDIATWSVADFSKNIIDLHYEILSEPNSLDIPVAHYRPVLNAFDSTTTALRPFLYEVIADRLIQQIQGLIGAEPQHFGSFTLNDAVFFADAEIFISQPLIHNDSLSAHYQMVRIFQKLLDRQIRNQQYEAQLDYDLKRLNYIYQNATLPNKRELYIASLKNLATRAKITPGYTEVIAELASETMQAANRDSMAMFHAFQMLSDALDKYPGSFGASRCRQLTAEITRAYIQLHAEQVYTSKSPIIMDMDFKNISSIVIDLIPLSQDEWPSLTRYRDEDAIKKMLLNKRRLYSFSDSLLVHPHFLKKRKQMSFPALPYGHYAIVLRDRQSEVYQHMFFTVSDLSYTSFKYKEGTLFIIKDRKNGAPVKNTILNIMPMDNRGRGSIAQFPEEGSSVTVQSYVSGKEGRVYVPGSGRSIYRVSLRKGKDRFDGDQWIYNFPENQNQAFRWAEFFTDRAIYRPGQTVFFKALMLEQKTNQAPTILKGEKISVVLQDANYKEVSRINLTSGSFGSVQGSFVIPEGRLNGQYTLYIQSDEGISGGRAFQVEEYKRPVFKVSMSTPDSTSVLNSHVTVKGIANTYSGAAVSNANVTYRVVRNSVIPYWYNLRMPYPSEPFVIASSSTQTDSEGRFSITFNALSEEKTQPGLSPYYTFSIEADITDSRGETQSGKLAITLSHEPYALYSNLKSESDKSLMSGMVVKAIDSNNRFLKVPVTLSIFELRQPNQVAVYKLYEGSSDYSETFGKKRKYKHIPIDQEKNYTSWPSDKILEIETISGDSLLIDEIRKAGCYRIDMVSVSKEGKTIRRSEYIQVTDFRRGNFPKTKMFFVKAEKPSYQPGEVVTLQMGSPEGKVFANIALARNGKVFEERSLWVTSKTEVAFPVLETYRGGFTIVISAIKHNRIVKETLFIPVPWNNKKLNFTFTSFRDQTLPGSREKYSIKISGEQREKLTAEVVAAMYDASLDVFSTQYWRTDYYPGNARYVNINTSGFAEISATWYGDLSDSLINIAGRIIPSLISFYPYDYWNGYYEAVDGRSVAYKRSAVAMAAEPGAAEGDSQTLHPKPDAVPTEDENRPMQKKPDFPISPRKNLNETVFFYPDLKTDEEGNLILEFTMNEALTSWRMMLFAHTDDFATGYDEKIVVTKKDLMVIPGVPRFVREGDQVQIMANIINSGSETIQGKARLVLYQAETMQDITQVVLQSTDEINFAISASSDQLVSWDLNIPEQLFRSLIWRITAEGGQLADGEQNIIPVISNRTMITESLPVWTQGSETKKFTFNALEHLHKTGRTGERVIVEYTAHPVWYAIQALPYIHASGTQTSLQLSERLYINSIAEKITRDFPRIREVFDVWKSTQQEALKSPLSKNMELKSAQLQETPWMYDAQTEAEQRQQIVYLFDVNRIEQERKMTIEKLNQRQLANGGFSWLPGGRENVFITQQIMDNLAFMAEVGAIDLNDANIQHMVSKGLAYLDQRCLKRHQDLIVYLKKYGGNPDDNHLDALTVQYLYIKGRFSHVQSAEKAKEAIQYYTQQLQKYWTQQPLYLQAMAGLYAFRKGDQVTSAKIVKSILERAKSNPEAGMYWLEGSGYTWYQLPLERHVTIMQLLEEAGDQKSYDEARVWLMKQKQANHWKTSKATISAIQALLSKSVWNTGHELLGNLQMPEIIIGNQKLDLTVEPSEAGSGYIRKEIPISELTRDSKHITIKGTGAPISWGSLYYQFSEPLEEVMASVENPLKLGKRVFIEKTTEKGTQLVEAHAQTVFEPGDKIVVRIDLFTDREMDYVLLRDMHISGFEPTEVISGYRYEGGLLYYQEHKDLSTQLWFDQLPKGRHQIELSWRARQKGSFSGGLTTIESMYAPEFRSHSEGFRIEVR